MLSCFPCDVVLIRGFRKNTPRSTTSKVLENCGGARLFLPLTTSLFARVIRTVRDSTGVIAEECVLIRPGHLMEKTLYTEKMAIALRLPMIKLCDGSSGGGSVSSIQKQVRLPNPPSKPGLSILTILLGLLLRPSHARIR